MVTQKETSKNEKENYNMWLFWTLLIVGVLYVGIGFLVTFINAQGRGDTFKVNWSEILRWPKSVFGR
jgi:hypothetical protein